MATKKGGSIVGESKTKKVDGYTIDYDLDAKQQGQAKHVLLRGTHLTIVPITTEDYYDLTEERERLEKLFKNKTMTDAQAKKAYDRFRGLLEELIPGLKGIRCSPSALGELANACVATIIPDDVKELEKRGLTPKNSTKKKAVRTVTKK